MPNMVDTLFNRWCCFLGSSPVEPVPLCTHWRIYSQKLMQFFWKICRIVCCPPPMGNPGSALGTNIVYSVIIAVDLSGKPNGHLYF